jgi:hypothetical protein
VLHISSNHGFIKLKDGKLFNSRNNSSMVSLSSKTGWSTSAPTMASSSSRIVSYSIQRTIVPTKASSSSRMVSYSVQRALVPNMASSSSRTESSTSQLQPWLQQAQRW